jgi:transposase InsO family protein
MWNGEPGFMCGGGLSAMSCTLLGGADYGYGRKGRVSPWRTSPRSPAHQGTATTKKHYNSLPVPPLSRRGNCYDNAAMESWNSTLKSELGDRFESPADAKAKLFDYIEVFYNHTRMHSAIDYASPAEFERATALAPSGTTCRNGTVALGPWH